VVTFLLYVAAWTASEWAALAGWAAVCIAAIASFIALRQVREARRLREEQSQPYVVAYMEPSAATPQIIDLVVRNFGTTVAHNVELKVDPPLRRSAASTGDEQEEVWLFDRLPVLVPGQEWRTLWDFGPSRAGSDLPDKHQVVVLYEDSRNRPLPPVKCILDWTPYKGRRWVTTYSLHDAAKALREINSKLSRWQEGGGLRVWVRDGDARDQRMRDEMEAQAKILNEESTGPDEQESIDNRTTGEVEK
jgi:hypothetical protein